MQLVDDLAIERERRLAHGRRRDRRRHDRLRHEARAVDAVALRQAVAPQVEQRRLEVERPVERQRVGIDEQLGGVEAMPGLGLPGPLGAEAIARARRHAVDMAVMDIASPSAKTNAAELRLARRVEQAEQDRFGMGRPDRDIDAMTRGRDTERLRNPNPIRQFDSDHASGPLRQERAIERGIARGRAQPGNVGLHRVLLQLLPIGPVAP